MMSMMSVVSALAWICSVAGLVLAVIVLLKGRSRPRLPSADSDGPVLPEPRDDRDRRTLRIIRATWQASMKGYVVHAQDDDALLRVEVIDGHDVVLTLEGDGSDAWLAALKKRLGELPPASAAAESRREREGSRS